MPKRRIKKSADVVEETPSVEYRAVVGLTNDRMGRTYGPGDVLTVEDFSAEVLEHWAETGRVVRSDG